jgi:hypothetical protein
MDFTKFDHREHLPILTWLGKREWTNFKDYPEKRSVSIRPRPFVFNPPQGTKPGDHPNAIVVYKGEYERYPKTHWTILKEMLRVLEFDVIGTFWYNCLSKSLAGGPKLFRPTTEQCVALEHTAATFPFDMYRQPYPVVILEIPEGYRTHLVERYHVSETPSHVLVHHDDKNNYISVSAFLSMSNIITHLTPKREEYENIEDSITKNRNRRKDHILADVGRIAVNPESEADFDAAENVQRLAMNFAMMMTLLGVKNQGVENPEQFRRWQAESRATRRGGIPTHRAIEAQENMAAAMYMLAFEQQIDFYDEIEEQVAVGDPVELERLHKSPRTHWRRGHWAQQPHGPMSSLRKAIYRKPKLVNERYFLGDVKNTSVTYTAHPKRDG